MYETIICTITPRFLMDFLRRLTTSFPSTPLDLKPLVQDTKKLCKQETLLRVLTELRRYYQVPIHVKSVPNVSTCERIWVKE